MYRSSLVLAMFLSLLLPITVTAAAEATSCVDVPVESDVPALDAGQEMVEVLLQEPEPEAKACPGYTCPFCPYFPDLPSANCDTGCCVYESPSQCDPCSFDADCGEPGLCREGCCERIIR